MPIDENGFLGNDAIKISEQIRERHKSLFELCLEVNRFAQKSKFELIVDNKDTQKLLATAFYLRILESAQAVILLVERGFELEAATVLRSAFDSLVYLKLCVEDKKFSEEYIIYSEIKKLDDLKNILSLKFYESVEKGSKMDIESRIKNIEDELKKKNLKIGAFKTRFHKVELSKRADLFEFYAPFYSVCSEAAHTGLRALMSKHFKIKQDNVVEITHGPSDEAVKRHLTAVVEFILTASGYIFNFFKIAKDSQIEALKQKELKLFGVV